MSIHNKFVTLALKIVLIRKKMWIMILLPWFIFQVRYAVTLGYPLSKAKWLFMIRNITTLPARLVVGHLSDIAFRHRKVKLLVQIFYPMFGLASFLCSFVRSFPLLMLYMGCNGLIEAVIWVTFPLLADEIAGGYHSDEAYSLICFTSAFCVMAGPPALGEYSVKPTEWSNRLVKVQRFLTRQSSWFHIPSVLRRVIYNWHVYTMNSNLRCPAPTVKNLINPLSWIMHTIVDH